MQRVEIHVYGIVQGVGFRPFVANLARSLRLTGSVENIGGSVRIEAQGEAQAIEEFISAIEERKPAAARIDSLSQREIAITNGAEFLILASIESDAIFDLPIDLAMCGDCQAEIKSQGERRYQYPFTTCTNCGPRWSVIEKFPYDRANTTLDDFPMCERCTAEYKDEVDRRYHAQSLACPDCGPQLESGALESTISALRNGSIVAIKGIGGYHFVVDALNKEAVERLRSRKGRGKKPFAVMARSIEVAERYAELSESAIALLKGSVSPIVMAPSREGAVNEWVAPETHTIGIMIPNSPLHRILFDRGGFDLLVMTSGNRSEEPIAIDNADAQERLGEIADSFLHHNRRIYSPIDDSVVKVVGGKIQVIRQARGLAPLYLKSSVSALPTLAVGGELKNAISLAQGERLWLSPHIGDVTSIETLKALETSYRTLASLVGVEAGRVVSDLHPDYLSTRWAQHFAAEKGIEHILVQHHHAHIASLAAEHGCVESEIIGLSFDGMGYGSDGSIWGGEFLAGPVSALKRYGHLEQIHLVGGDQATKFPIRSAIAHLHRGELLEKISRSGYENLIDLDPKERSLILQILDKGIGGAKSTSMGRFFDAASALLGICTEVVYEGQAAIELESLAAQSSTGIELEIGVRAENDMFVLESLPILLSLIEAVRTGQNRSAIAYGFHSAIAHASTEIAVKIREATSINTAGLSGGVFQNSLLTNLLEAKLRDQGFEVLTHRRIPPSDAGLSVGQVALANLR